MTKACAICSAAFVTKTNSLYCSASCRKIGYAAMYRAHRKKNLLHVREMDAKNRERNGDRIRARHTAWRSKNKTKIAAYMRKQVLKHNFGITPEQYDGMLASQGGVCAVCKKACRSGRRLAVDHDHATGAVRGLLCSPCNTAIGQFQESPRRMEAAAAYVRTHQMRVVVDGRDPWLVEPTREAVERLNEAAGREVFLWLP